MITSTEPRLSAEQQQDLATSEALKGAAVAAIKEQQKASQIMAERLPGLTDPNAPADQQPLKDSSPPNPVAHTPLPLHPDRFTPGAQPSQEAPAGQENKPASKPAQPDNSAKPQREP